MKKWKVYVQYKKVKRNNNITYSTEHLNAEFPGKISNETLLKDFKKYYRQENTEDPTNYVVRNKIREGYDYKLMPRECWQLLFTKYGGLEIKRLKDTEFYSRKFLIRFPKVYF